ncbi:MAG: RES family NAD+ phosphorylase [Zetaproteobacteria bacterium]|nr:RES family NAD+ phosphorylase [Zetaproteobacteria bacterium]
MEKYPKLASFHTLTREILQTVEQSSLKHLIYQSNLKTLAQTLEPQLRQLASCYQAQNELIQPLTGNYHRGVKAQYLNHRKSSANRPLAYDGSIIYPGRFHLQGQPTLYFASRAKTVIDELKMEDGLYPPTTLMEFHVQLQRVLHLDTEERMRSTKISRDLCEEEWKYMNDLLGIHAYPQLLSDQFVQLGYEGVLVRSTRSRCDLCLVVFVNNLLKGSSIRLVGNPEKLKRDNKILKQNQKLLGFKSD